MGAVAINSEILYLIIILIGIDGVMSIYIKKRFTKISFLLSF